MKEFKVDIYSDGANLQEIEEMVSTGLVRGLTTNPTLIKKNDVPEYSAFAIQLIQKFPKLPISFEVISDDIAEMIKQARVISSWGKNVFVKIPICNSQGVSTARAVEVISKEGIKLNVTAMMTIKQLRHLLPYIESSTEAFVSIFAGRIADTGRDPIPLMSECVKILNDYPHIRLIWASPREVLNIYQADELGCDVITATPELIRKLKYHEYDLEKFTIDTVKMFLDDAKSAKLTI